MTTLLLVIYFEKCGVKNREYTASESKLAETDENKKIENVTKYTKLLYDKQYTKASVAPSLSYIC